MVFNGMYLIHLCVLFRFQLLNCALVVKLDWEIWCHTQNPPKMRASNIQTPNPKKQKPKKGQTQIYFNCKHNNTSIIIQYSIMKQQERIHLPAFIAVLHIALRIILANRAPITDCDEVFNYWEPLHFIHYGYGMQTWEYAPQYALRTYAYLLPLSIISRSLHILLGILPPFGISLLSKSLCPLGLGTAAAAVAIGAGGQAQAQVQKVLLFQLLRATIACGTAISELRLVNALPSRSLALSTWMALVTSTGMFHTAPAYLPSTTVMVCYMHSIAEQLDFYYDKNTTCTRSASTIYSLDRAIIWGLVCCLMTGWPFCAVLFVPLGFQAVHHAYVNANVNANDNAGGQKQKQKQNERTVGLSTRIRIGAVVKLLLRVVGYCIIIQSFVTAVDYHYYGKVISPTWNIFVYNTGLGGDGINRDELYGVDDCMYYIKNLILNWNGVAVMGMCAIPVLLGSMMFSNSNASASWRASANASVSAQKKDGCVYSYSKGNMVVILLPAVLWIGIVFSRPHKEERFLFPVYPLIAIGASVCLDQVMELTNIHNFFAGKLRSGAGAGDDNTDVGTGTCRIKVGLALMALLPCAMISISRSMLLVDGYTAPLKLYSDLYRVMNDSHANTNQGMGDGTHATPTLVCTGGEWYRFPSSYYLPPDTSLAFLKSSFDGQLPQPFTEFGSKEESLALQGRFNDLNEEEMDRYVDVSECSFVIELVGEDISTRTRNENENDVSEVVKYMKDDENDWRLIAQYDFLDVEKTSSLHRILYLPVIRKASYKQYSLFQRGEKKEEAL